MKIALYEEYPTEANLSRLDQLDFPVDLILRADSLPEFEKIKESVKAKHPQAIKIGYWPALKKDEGYWMSYFSKPEGINRILEEIEQRDQSLPLWLMWDAESPLFSSPKLLATESTKRYKNKQRIEHFMKTAKNRNVEVETAENPVFLVPPVLQRFLGESFSPEEYGNTKIVLAYSSFLRAPLKKLSIRLSSAISNYWLRKETSLGVRKHGDKFGVGLGCLAQSTTQPFAEPVLSPQELKQDLEQCAASGVKNIRLYRLGGLTHEMIDVLRQYSDRNVSTH